MPELTEEDLQARLDAAKTEGREEQRLQMEQTEQWQKIYETEAISRRTEEKVDQLISSLAIVEPEPAPEPQADPDPTTPPAEEVPVVEEPEESPHPEKPPRRLFL